MVGIVASLLHNSGCMLPVIQEKVVASSCIQFLLNQIVFTILQLIWNQTIHKDEECMFERVP